MASSPALKTVLERPRTSVAMLYSLSSSTSPENSFSPIYRSRRDSRGDLASASATHSNSARSASTGRALGSRGITITQKGELFYAQFYAKRAHTSTCHLRQCSKSSREYRVPADELEELVISQVQSFLQSPQRLQDVLCSRSAGSVEIQRAAECARKWAAAAVAQVRAVVSSIVKRVIVHDNLIELQLSRRAIREAVTGLREVPSLAN